MKKKSFGRTVPRNESSPFSFLRQSKRKVLNFLRKFSLLNSFENKQLTEEYKSNVNAIKEKNSQAIFESYYLPRAISAILREDNYLTTPSQAEPRATAMMLADYDNGVLDEFYRFK